MSLISKIKQEQLESRKNKNVIKTRVLTALYSETSIVGKNNGNRETTDIEAVAVIKKFIKNLNETISIVSKDVNKDISELKEELSIYETFLPKQLTEEELSVLIKDLITKIENPSIKSMGIVMGILNKEYTGLFDGSLASKIVKEELARL